MSGSSCYELHTIVTEKHRLRDLFKFTDNKTAKAPLHFRLKTLAEDEIMSDHTFLSKYINTIMEKDPSRYLPSGRWRLLKLHVLGPSSFEKKYPSFKDVTVMALDVRKFSFWP